MRIAYLKIQRVIEDMRTKFELPIDAVIENRNRSYNRTRVSIEVRRLRYGEGRGWTDVVHCRHTVTVRHPESP